VQLQRAKTKCYIDPRHAEALEAHRGDVPLGEVVDDDGGTHLGITVYGAPIGSEGYVRTILARKCDEIAGISDKLINTLGSSHKQALWVLTLLSTSRKFDYFARHNFPADTADSCATFDNIILKQAAMALGFDPENEHDGLMLRRLRMPLRHGGFALRAVAPTAPSAFWAAAYAAVPAFLDRLAPMQGGVAVRGVLELPVIEARVGRDSFLDMRAHGWRRFLASGSRLGAELALIWAGFQSELQGAPPGGPPTCVLHLPAGRSSQLCGRPSTAPSTRTCSRT